MAARVFIWITTGGGAWAIAANWDDLTDSISPSQVVPGSLDSVAVTGPAGNSAYAVTGNATLAAAQFAGDLMLSGNVTATTLTAGLAAAGGVLQLAAGSTLASSSATLAGGSVLVNGTNTQFAVAGQLTMGTALAGGYPAASELSVTAGGHASVLAVLMRTANSQIYVDPSSIMEIGTLTTGAKGKLTVDQGFILLGQGSANQYGSLVDNGNIYAFGGTLAVGTVTGFGHLGISANATMLLEGPDSAGEQVIFAGGNATLEIAAEAYTPLGTITGFATGDAIDYRGSPISAAVFNASSSSLGVLTLYYGTAVAAQLNLAGNYSASTFLTAGDGSNGTLIEVAPAVTGSGTASAGTSTPDIYAWTATGSGTWGSASNWQDQTSGASPAAIAPGAANIVDIAVSQSGFTVIAGPANAASLSLTGEAALTGTFAIGTLSIGTVSGTSFTNGGLDLLAGAVIRSSIGTVGAGAISAAGAGALLSVAGTLSMGGGISGVGLPVTALSATAGGRIRAGALAIGGGSGDSITTDPSGSVEIGTLANAGIGSVTVDAGAAITGNGSINPFGAVVDNGTITASGGVLVLGSVTGTGQLAIGNGALELTYATALPIAFTSASSTLAIGGPAAIPTGTLTGIVPGDVIDLLGSPLSGVQFVAGTSSTTGTLLLIYNGVTIGKLSAGPFNKISFVATPDGQTGTDIGFLVGSGGSGATGQTGTDPLVWTGAANGNWSIAVNWNDTVTAKAATLPPGVQTATVITGGSGANFQSITGTGMCASLVLNGNGFFFGNFTANSLSIGQDSSNSATSTAGTLVTTVLTTFTLGSCLVADGAFLVAGNKSVVDVAGTLAVSDNGLASVLSITQKATSQVGALTLAGGSVSVDVYSSLEVGTLGSAATGLLTIDPGAVASGYGTLDQLGTIAVNGTVSAAGGTLLMGPASGTGTLVIATEAALGLTAATSVPIAMAGAGATLILEGINARALGVIGGFAPGDSIVTSNTPIDSVSYQPGTGNLGVLALSEAGQQVESLTLAGNYAGDSFSVQPDGSGAAVIVSGAGSGGTGTGGGPPAGTVTPDQYVWTGSDGVLWADAKNWIDSTTSTKTAAAVPPGQNNLVTIAVPSGGAEQVTGPGNAAQLTSTGSLALVGTYGIGTLTVGTALSSGVLAMGNGTDITTAGAAIIGGIAGFGGTLAVGGSLTLGQGSLAGLVSANGSTAISADLILMQGVGSALLTDTSATVEVGGIAAAAAGSVSIDAAGTITGTGVINPNGLVVDNGMVAASDGTLTLGAVSGSGTLLVGVAASMVIEGAVAAGVTVDFAAGGTLTLAGAAAGFAGGIADFGPGDQILLPMSGATAAEYVLTGPGLGQLTIYAGNQVLTRLTLLGSQADYVFSVAGSAGGGTILTATPSNMAGGEGSTMGSYPSVSGGFVISPTTLYALAPADAYQFLLALNGGPTNTNPNDYEYFLAGDTTVVGPALYSTIGELGVDVEVIGPLSGEVAPGGFGPGSNVVLQAGYNALIAEGTNPINLFDQDVGNSLLVSNEGADNLVAGADNDTLVGAAGANTVFFASGAENVTIQGGGNDTINSSDNSQVTTSAGQSDVFLGGTTNNVVSYGADAILAGTVGIADDTVTDNAAAGSAGETVFGPSFGSLFYNGGASPGTVVGGGGQIVVNAGSAENVVWSGNSFVQYNGGTGAAAIAGGTQGLFVQGGTGPETVFGGTGTSVILGAPGNSIYVMGLGPATISAAAGNTVWVTGSAQVSVLGAAGVIVYAGLSSAGHLLQATAGSETLCGGEGNDTFYAGSGSGIFVSDGGADVFNFLDGQTGGTDEIFGFVPGLDTLGLQGYGFSVPQLNVVNGNTYFTLSDGTNVELYSVTNLSSSSFNVS